MNVHAAGTTIKTTFYPPRNVHIIWISKIRRNTNSAWNIYTEDLQVYMCTIFKWYHKLELHAVPATSTTEFFSRKNEDIITSYMYPHSPITSATVTLIDLGASIISMTQIPSMGRRLYQNVAKSRYL